MTIEGALLVALIVGLIFAIWVIADNGYNGGSCATAALVLAVVAMSAGCHTARVMHCSEYPTYYVTGKGMIKCVQYQTVEVP